jgi:mannose-6-phosphate isomerase-like protein (cupin superfamily)
MLKVVASLIVLALSARASDYVTAAEIEAALKTAPPESKTYDKLIKTIDAGGYKVSIAVVRRLPQSPSDTSALVHKQVTEVYEVLKGSGPMETGGVLTNPQPYDLTSLAAGPSLRGGMRGGETRRIGPGDIAVILPGVPHGFGKLDETITYLVTRIELTTR